MLKIHAIRAAIGKNVTAKLRNEKDDKHRVIEFTFADMAITLQQLDDLVACGKHERKFSEVAFSSVDAMSELRHFKKIELVIEVQNATVGLQQIADKGRMTVEDCTIKKIQLAFAKDERCMMSAVVQTPLDSDKLLALGSWGSSDMFVSIDAAKHGIEPEKPQNDLDV